MNNTEVIYTLISFLVVGLIFLTILGIIFKILLKKYSLDNKKIKFYGLFLGMNNKQILSFSMTSLNYIFLLFNLLSFNELNIIIAIISLLLSIISDILSNNIKFTNILYEIISLATLYVNKLLFDFVTNQNSTVVLICLVSVIVLSTLLYSFVLFKTLNNIIIKDKYIKEDKYSI